MRRMLLVVVVAALLPVVAFAQEASPVASPVASVDWGDWAITLTGAEFADVVAPDSYEPETAHGKYLVVRLDVLNESLTPANFPVYDASARDDRLRVFDMDYDATSALLSDETGMYPSLDNLQPGIVYPYVLVFDVAPDAKGFTLLLEGEGEDDASFKVGI